MSNGRVMELQNQSQSTEMSWLSEDTTASEPRSRRVDSSGHSEDFRLSTATTVSTISSSSSQFAPSSPPTTSPPIPPRSPLRPTARAAPGPHLSAQPSQASLPLLLDPASADLTDEMPLLHSRSFGSVSGLLDQPLSVGKSHRPTTPDKPLPLTPQPSNPISLSLIETEDDDDESTLLASESQLSSSVRSSVTAVMSKRNHALLELLSSERAYASDLALVRAIHIPLASDLSHPYSTAPATPPASSASSSRTLSTASDSSGVSSVGAPMTKEDIKIIFNNVEAIAQFADELSAALEGALGNVLEGGRGEDYVGRLFLDIIPLLEPLYRTYITKHSDATEHLNKLPATPALKAYFAQTHALSSTLSHAWDLQSLLIKPVQRLLKYPLLLNAIIEETPDAHGDKQYLREAREKLEEVARGVNESRRRREVVREVLANGVSGLVGLNLSTVSTPQKGSELKAKKKGLNLSVAASVSLGRMKSLRTIAFKTKEGAEGNEEAEAIKEMAEKLSRYDTFLRDFAKDALDWAENARGVTVALGEWAGSFGRVIWLTGDGPEDSPAFEAFLELINDQLLPICDAVKGMIKEGLLGHITSLLETTIGPLHLLDGMTRLQPFHYGLLNLNVAKTRPTPSLLEMSQWYVALRGQLYAELPTYLVALETGVAACLLRFAEIQRRFYAQARGRWADLWDALKVDEEANLGAAETLRVWWSRFAEIEEKFRGLNIVRPLEKKSTPEKAKEVHLKAKRSKGHGVGDGGGGGGDIGSSVVVSSVLAALDPLSIPHPHPSPSESTFGVSPGSASAKTRSVHSMESDAYGMAERKSLESLHSKKSSKSGKSRRPSSARAHSAVSSTLVDEGPAGFAVPPLAALAPTSVTAPYSRMRSMPLSPALGALHKSQSVSRLLDVEDSYNYNVSTSSLNSVPDTIQDDGRGRPSRKPSFRRRLTDSFRASGLPSTDARHRRSPSLPTYNNNNNNDLNRSPSPNRSTFAPSVVTPSSHSSNGRRRAEGGMIPCMYECRVVHPCDPPPGVSYLDLPFFTLRLDDVYEILQEAGHPSRHRDLPLYVDDGEDCLLLARSETGEIGWVLASFMVPVD